MKVSELRHRAIIKIAERSADYVTDTIGAIQRATKAMNSFYRFAGFSISKFYYENDSRHYNTERAARLDEIENRRMAKVNDYLKEFNITVRFNGLYPSLCDSKPAKIGCYNDLMLTYWY